MLKLLIHAKNYRKQIILGPFFKFLEAVFELFLPLLMARLVDEGINAKNSQVVWQMMGLMVLLSIVGLGCAVICQYYSSIASQGFGTQLRNRLMEKINELSFSQLNHFGTDSLITRTTNDVNQLQLALAMLIRLVVRAPFLSIGAVIMAFTIDWQAGLLFLLVLPLFCLLLFVIIKSSVPLYKKAQSLLDRVNQLVEQNLSGVRVIRAYTGEKREVSGFHQGADNLAKVSIRVNNLSAILTPATTLILNLGILALFAQGAPWVNSGRLAQGEILALVNYMNQMLLALIVVSNLVVIFTRAAASAQRLNEVLDTPTEQPVAAKTTDSKDALTPDLSKEAAVSPLTANAATKVQFDQVDFRYGADYGLALQDISFTIEPGMLVGITGATGSGKTTLTQLIAGFYPVTSGEIRLNDRSLAQWPPATLVEQIAQVPQKAVLFSGTIRDNLQWGKSDATDEECWCALEIAQAAEFVRALPNQLDTEIFEGGQNLSGGQRQRLTIARALIKKAPLLILDDSLSALDYQTDLKLRQALSQTQKGTVMIISQRISSIAQADLILVMDQGRLVSQGTHQELAATSPAYQAILASQEEGVSHA
ncbi:ABC transporter ATP-binding protein [Enterococcus asini]|uniref:ABC transporter ATP-binding protein n=1 Tax=Enterococcus asini TaxID=57732 RepID=UPI0026DCD1A5|nr:ABC transporter ATP-binding protein [Enterococcus asini]